MRGPILDIYIVPSKNDNWQVIERLIEMIDEETTSSFKEEKAKEIKELLDENEIIYE